MKKIFFFMCLFPSTLFAGLSQTNQSYRDETAIRREFNNIYLNAQGKQFVVFKSTPNLNDLQDGQMVLVSSVNKGIAWRDGTTVNFLTSSGTLYQTNFVTFTSNTYISNGVSRIVAGSNITITPSGGTGEVTINSSGGGGSAFSVNDEESLIVNSPSMLNFKGSGVNVTLDGTTATITIAGSGSGGCENMWDLDPATDLMPSLNPSEGSGCGNSNPPLGVFHEEVQITSPTVQINFKGSGVSVSQSGSTATVTITGGGSGSISNGSNSGDLTELDDNGDIMPSLVTFANDVNCDLDSNNHIMFKSNVSRAPTFFVGGIGLGGVWELTQNELDFTTIQ